MFNVSVDEQTADPAPGGRPDGPAVRGPAAVAGVAAWCALALIAVNVVGGALAMLQPWWPVVASAGFFLALASVVAVVPVAVVGWPVGLLTAWCLRHEAREARHVLVFALVGAGTALALWAAGLGGGLDAAALQVLPVFVVEGALGAGAGRWAAGAARRRRARRAVAAPAEPAGVTS